jgi:hypothetical protein
MHGPTRNSGGVFSTRGKADGAAKDAGHGSVVLPLELDRPIPVKRFVADH